jgi:muramoyltetrapeptide carboxypeptidase
MNMIDKKIAIISPASMCLQQDIDYAQQVLTDNFSNFHFMPSCYSKMNASGRADEIIDLLNDLSVDVIWTMRGGEGSADCLPYLATKIKEINPDSNKAFIGFSDITSLLLFFSQQNNFKINAIHGPTVTQYCYQEFPQKSKKILESYITSTVLDYKINLTPLNAPATEISKTEVEITGGNLTLVCLSIGDINQINANNKIVILEEVGEKPYAIRRSLNYLKRINIFENCKAIIFGSLSEHFRKKENEYEKQIQEELQIFADNITKPILKTNMIGHGINNICYQYRKNAKLHLGKNCFIKF